MKTCGYNEPCFTNGEEEWGHLGGCMCKYLGERRDENTDTNVGVCSKDKSNVVDVNAYCCEWQYKGIIELQEFKERQKIEKLKL